MRTWTTWRPGAAAVVSLALLAGCTAADEPGSGTAARSSSGGQPGPTYGPALPDAATDGATTDEREDSPAATSAPTATPTPTEPDPAPTPGATTLATPAPDWLGTRVLGPPGSGPVAPQQTPPELLDRRVQTVDLLPPPPDEQFVATVAAVPADVLARSTWQPACPVRADHLRYVEVSFWGFDGRPHTGELMLHADAVEAVVAAFDAMHRERFPLEAVRVVSAAELDAPPTGDGNTTSAFVCRPVTGGSGWSQHAYGRAVDINPFHNPYERGEGADRVVIPELATAYTDRGRQLPGMLQESSAAVTAFRAAGWTWGGDYRSLKDWQHFSADGG